MIDALTNFEGKGSRTFLGFTPVKTSVVDNKYEVTDDVPAPHISKCGHAGLVSVYFILCAAYLAYAIYEYVERPEVESFSQLPSSKFDAPQITVRLQCYDEPNCGQISLIRNYSTAEGCPPEETRDREENKNGNKLTDAIPVTLCYVKENSAFSTSTGDLLSTPGVSIDFSRITTGERNTTKAFAAVVVEAGGMRKLVNIESWQVKTFYVGMAATIKDGKTTYDYYSQNLQYDGKRSTWRATYIIRLSQFVNVYEVTRPGHWLEILAQLGGVATLVGGALLLSEPLITKCFPGKEARLEKGRMAATRGKAFRQSSTIPVSSSPSPDPASDASQNPLRHEFRVSEPVKVLYGGSWHPAKVLNVHGDGTLDISWADGTFSKSVPTAEVKPL